MTTTPRTPDTDTIDGRYVLGPVIGHGAMAEVHAAEDLRLGRPVAVKLLRVNLAELRESRLRFEEEARAAARLSDPNVVAVYDTGEHCGRPFIVMELLPGRTLHDELRAGPLSETRAREVIGAVLLALRAAHDAGVIHRDIKPANVLLAESGDAKVADFGIAKVAETDLTATGLVLGTPSYLAPECVNGDAATAASDLYAVGVVLYEALAGRRPFEGDSPIAVCHAICNEVPPRLADLRPDLSEPLTTVVTRAMAKDPRDRYRSADEMLRALDGDLATVPSPADEPTQAIEAEPTLVGDATRTQILVPIAADGGASRASVVGARRSWLDWTRAHVKLLVASAAVFLAIALMVNLGGRRADTFTTTPRTTLGPTATTISSPRPTTSAPTSPPRTEPTKPDKKGGGNGHGKPPKED